MSERSETDEIAAAAREFARILMTLASQHGRAANWFEQRQIRKQVSLALRQQRRAEYMDRHMQKINTARSVEQYRAHALAVQQRSNNPNIDGERRYRDNLALRSHAADLQQTVLERRGLTPVEQGIALDGIDAATAFPGHQPKRGLFAGAQRVKGIDALRYRANVARTRAALPRQIEELNEQRRQADLVRSPQRQTSGGRSWKRDAATKPVRKGTPQEQEHAVQQLRRAQLQWHSNVAETDPSEQTVYDRSVARAARAAAKVGVSPERIAYERALAVENSRFTASVYSLRPGSNETQVIQTVHPTEREAAEWTHRTVRSTNWVPQVSLKAVVHERGAQSPARVADGGYEQVTTQTKEWVPSRQRQTAPTAATEAPAGGDADRLAQVEKQLKTMAQENSRLVSKVTTLQRGLDAVTNDRNEMRTKLDAAEGRIESLTNRNQRLAAEIDEVRRQRPDVEQLRTERDQFKTERDEAVARLIKRTPPAERLGSPQRVTANTNTQSMPSPNGNGHGRNGIERNH